MINRPRTHLLAPLVALSMTLAMAAPANAQNRQYQDRQQDRQYRQQDRQYQGSQGAVSSIQINFRNQPRWAGIPGTQVREIRQGDRTDYDMFRYGRNYYVYNNDNNRWYGSRRWRGQFTLLDDRSVPRELRRIPRDHWRNYPTAWQDRNQRDRNNQDRNYGDSNYPGNTSATLQVNYGARPRWSGISGTNVEWIPQAERSNYDVFRYGGSYYAYSDNRWYMSPRESGSFAVIDDRYVPSELSQISRDHWRNYPAGWGNDNNNGRRNSRGNGGY